MNAKITMGPWTAESVGSGGSYDNPVDVYEVNNGFTRICEYVAESDAKLIAAAPDLLAALEMLLKDYQAALSESRQLTKAVDAARAAIAKAQS
jgi:hypothetical protein